jgi:CheY-like chemotaxis protein
VLIVEDEVDALEAMAELLADDGFQTRQAGNGQEALEILRSGWRPALILLDIKMPVMDGCEFLRRMSDEPGCAEIPVTIITASATLIDVPFRNKDGGLLRKPVDYGRLLRIVHFYCG